MNIASEFCKRWSEMTRWMRTASKCRHEFDYMHDMAGRDANGNVSCVCHKCGEVFKAECGLDLPGRLVQLNRLAAPTGDHPAKHPDSCVCDSCVNPLL